MPLRADGVQLPWDAAMSDVVAVISQARDKLGDTFVVESGTDRYLFTFSPTGVRSFYALPEERASKGVADWRMLRRKVPDELFSGRRTFPHDLFGRADAHNYLANVQAALASAVTELGTSGTVDVFEFTRRLGHRVGLASWGGPRSAEAPNLEPLIAAFDALDASEAFVHPDTMELVARNGKATEMAALGTVRDLLGVAVDAIDSQPSLADHHPLFARIATSWADEEPSVRRTGIADDVALVHVASMSNLFAAMGWALVDLFEHPASLARIADGDMVWAEQCAMESTRLAQRSIMSRFVLQPVTLDDGVQTYEIPRGVTVATLLPVTNTTSAPGYDTWDPWRWHRRRLVRPEDLAAVELVTVFGHGKHTCPAQAFSLAAMTSVARELGSTFEWAYEWKEHPRPLPTQIGGVSRAAERCMASYQKSS
ncbi:MAG TPA: hypothetical protein VKR22_08860 [Acidimicrobiales bacterium]|nr:hypothetical protein [Acidimicrobiales bacterium]